MDKIKKNDHALDKLKGWCTSCEFRHRCNRTINMIAYEPCKHWKLGGCYSCVYLDASEDEWYKRGCESEYPGKCSMFVRDWNASWHILKKRFFKMTNRVLMMGGGKENERN